MNEATPLPVYLVVTERNGVPAVEMRKVLTRPEDIQAIIQAAWNKTPLIVLPNISDFDRASKSLIDKGILYEGDDGKLYFV